MIDVSNADFGVKGCILEETEISRALFELYEGGIVSWGPPITVALPSHHSPVVVPASGQNFHRKSHHQSGNVRR